MKNFRLIFALLISMTILTACAVGQSSEPVRETRFLLNTVCTITIFELAEQSGSNRNNDNTITKRELINRSFDLISEYEALFSMTTPGSDVWRINQAAGDEVSVSPHTISIIKQGLYYAYLSDGMFDITIGQLSSLWKSTDNLSEIEAQIYDAIETVDFRLIEICEEASTIRLENPNTWLDLGGIAKGYIADRVSEFLIEQGVTSAIIDLGGDIITIGTRPPAPSAEAGVAAQNWRIAVRQPFSTSEYTDNGSSNSEFFGIINIGTASIVTSGIYERYFKADGVIYHHIIDPFTGFPANTDVVSATVIAQTALTGDVLSSMIVLVGSEKAEHLLNQAPDFIGALLILNNGDYIIIGEVDFKR